MTHSQAIKILRRLGGSDVSVALTAEHCQVPGSPLHSKTFRASMLSFTTTAYAVGRGHSIPDALRAVIKEFKLSRRAATPARKMPEHWPHQRSCSLGFLAAVREKP